MPLRPTRRIPKSAQRKASNYSRKVARKHVRKTKQLRRSNASTKLIRQWQRLERSIRASFKHVKIWIASLVVALVGCLVLFFLFSPVFSVTSIKVNRQDRRVDIEEIQQLLSPLFGKHMLFVSPIALEHTVREAYPEVSSVAVEKRFPHDLHVTILMDSVAAPVFIGDPEQTEADARPLLTPPEEGELPEIREEDALHHYITAGGIYLEYPFVLPIPGDTELVLPLLYLVDWAVKPAHRQELLEPELVRDLGRARDILQDSFGHSVHFITIYVRAREFHIETERIVLWFDFATPLTQQIERYREFLRTIPLEDVEEYIDLRLHDRVVYR